VAVPEVSRLVDAGNDAAAFPLLYKALQILPQDPTLNRLRREISHSITIRTTPGGASVYVKPYMHPEVPWLFIGQAPLQNFMLPPALFRLRIGKPGFRTVEAAGGNTGSSVDFMLDAEGSLPAEMIHVPGGNIAFLGRTIRLDDYWVDKYEVTNRQFKEFMDKG